MLKKIRRLLAFTLAFVMMFSMTAFAAEKETTIKLDNVEYSSEGPETRAWMTWRPRIEPNTSLKKIQK